MKKLVIVESPAKIKTITKFLDKDFKIMSTLGHIMDLPPKRLGVAKDNGTFQVEYVPIQDKEKTIAEICKAAVNADVIFLAPDPDREGEIIAWHTANEIKKATKKKKDIYRISFNEITKPAIQAAIKTPGTIDLDKVAAQQARRILDRWVGYEVSPVLWQKLAPGLSAGRVQSVALRLITDREREIQQFEPQEYWTIDGLFKHNTSELRAALSHISKKKIDIKNKKNADKVVSELKKETFNIDKIEDKTRKKNPMAPFMTSTLQQAAYNRLGFSVKKTMQVAQKLYEGLPLADKKSPVALITYMRTDSLRLSDTALKQARDFIKSNFKKAYLPSSANMYEKKTKGKKAKAGAPQDAHEAIRPIDTTLTPKEAKKYLPADAAKLYELIWQRFVACQMAPAEYAQRTIIITGGKFTFRATGSTLLFDGFLTVYADEEENKTEEKESILPPGLKEKDPMDLKKIDSKQHFTQPPPRFTEASLVKSLEKEGIGRPSTYATILNTIRARAYTKLDERKRFVPTELGFAVTDMLVKNLPRIMDVSFTARMEKELDSIAQGDLKRDKALMDFYDEFEKELATFRGHDGKRRGAVPTGIKCPQCKKNTLSIRFGRTGEFLGCSGYPDCQFTSNFEKDESGKIKLIETEKPELLDKKCPECKKALRKMRGRFGEFTACSGYPKCKYIERTKAGFKCPLDKGEVFKKAWRGGTFWGCDNYPKCKFAVFADIEEKKCPKCKLPFLAKKTNKEGETILYCSDKSCGYKP